MSLTMSLAARAGLTAQKPTEEESWARSSHPSHQSVDGYIVGPQDGPEHGLGIGGERLHYWVMGGPWTYAGDGHDTDGMHGADREYFESVTEGMGCRDRRPEHVRGRGRLGRDQPFPGPLVVLTHRTEDQPDPSTGFVFVDGFDAALLKAARARR